MNDMERRSMLAIALSFIVLTVWWGVVSKKRPVPPPDNRTANIGTEKTAIPDEAARERTEKLPAKTEEETEEECFKIENKNVRCLIGRKTGKIRNIFLSESLGEVDLIMPDAALPFRFFVKGIELSEPEVIKKENSVIMRYPQAQAVVSFDGGDLTLGLTSTGGEPVEAVWCGGLGTDADMLEEQIKSKLLRFHSKTDRVKRINAPKTEKNYDWISVSNRYFLLAFFQESAATFSCDPKDAEKYITFSSSGGKINLKIMAAAKEYFALKKRGAGLEKTLNLGIFSFLSVLFIYILSFFYQITGNYGWAIVILTFIVQALMFPLSRKNIKSAEAMKRIQPYVKKLQQQYKNDPKRLNEELMNLYKVQKVNPLGGCLPLVVQIPIFWSLFTLLQGLVELRGAPFIFWLNDLSRPDILFGHLPKFLPIIGGWPIGPLPLLMGATMFIQQKMTITDPQQKAFLLMPVFFTFIFIKFPSGLVLYWLTSNVITFGETLLLKRSK